MTSRPLVILGIVIIVVAVIAGIGYVAAPRGGLTGIENQIGDGLSATSSPSSTSPEFYQPTSTPPVGNSSTTDNMIPALASSTAAIPFPASSTVDTSSWLMYVDNSSGYSVEYPSDMLESASGGVLTLVLPKSAYFHWPLLDSAEITVYATTTCPDLVDSSIGLGPVQFTLNNMQFTRTIGTGVGAGQLYTEVAYDTYESNKCYRVDFFDHGTDGAGFYVDDASLIQKYDAQHTLDMSAAYGVLDAMVDSLKITSN